MLFTGVPPEAIAPAEQYADDPRGDIAFRAGASFGPQGGGGGEVA
jgi:hypothetical protein